MTAILGKRLHRSLRTGTLTQCYWSLVAGRFVAGQLIFHTSFIEKLLSHDDVTLVSRRSCFV
jgi:hypothetical protein